MKKIICLLLCLVFTCTMLVACKEDELGGYKENYEGLFTTEDREEIELDFYIIVGEGTTNIAINTVERMINQHIADKYSTKLDIHYVTADKYENEMLTAAKKTGEDRADLVLVVGEDMFDTLYDDGLLVDLNSYLTSKVFGKLVPEVGKGLMDMSKVEITTEKDGKTETTLNSFCVPNNHIIGEYTYIVVDKAAAEHFNYSENKLKEMTSLTNEYLVELQGKIAESDLFSDDAIREVKSLYNADSFENRDFFVKDGSYWIVSKKPVITRAEALSSAFAIIKDSADNGDVEGEETPEYVERYNRAMEMIYAINMDATLRNYLQYGVLGSNYTLDHTNSSDNVQYITPITSGSGVYNMDILHTGSVFNAMYSVNDGWTKEVADRGAYQNKEAVPQE